MKYYKIYFPAVVVLSCLLIAACTKEQPDSFSIDEQQYLLFQNIDQNGAPAILGNTFFTKEGNQTKIRIFYFNEAVFENQRTIALHENDVITNGTKIKDLNPLTSSRAGYTETMLDVPYEQAITQAYHLKVFKGDSVLATTDMGTVGFKGNDYNFSYPLLPYNGSLERGTMVMWQRRNESFYVNVKMDTMLVGNQYLINMYIGDTSVTNGQKWLTIGEIPNTTIGKKYKVINVDTNELGTKLNYDALKTSDIHIEVRRIPGNEVVAKAVAGKYKP